MPDRLSRALDVAARITSTSALAEKRLSCNGKAPNDGVALVNLGQHPAQNARVARPDPPLAGIFGLVGFRP